MAKIDEIKDMFNDVEGLKIITNDSGIIVDIILPPCCEIITKVIVDGALREIEFSKDNSFYSFGT